MLWLCFVLPLFVSIFPFVVVSVCHCVLSGVVCCGYARCCNCTSMFVGGERERAVELSAAVGDLHVSRP